MPNKDIKIGLMKKKETKQFIEYIKTVLAGDSEFVDYIDDIPFNYDEQMLKEMCNKEGININYSSSYYAEGKYNPYMPLDKVTFSKKRVR